MGDEWQRGAWFGQDFMGPGGLSAVAPCACRLRWRGEDAAGDTLGPGWREFAGWVVWWMGQAPSQEMAGLATERGRD